VHKPEIEELYNVINGDKSRFLSICAGLENALELLIAGYYTLGEDDYKKFLSVIFADDAELSFSKKIKMFERFLKKYYPEFLSEKPDFIQKLNRIRKMRNRFAHSINLTPEELQPFLGKKYFKLGFIEDGVPKEDTISFDEILARNTEAETVLHEISELQEKISQKAYERFVKHQEFLSSISKNQQDSDQSSS